MFNFVRSYVKKGLEWSSKDIRNEALSDILVNYANARIVVTWDTEPQEFSFTTKANRESVGLGITTNSLSQWLLTLPQDALVLGGAPAGLGSAQYVRYYEPWDIETVKVETTNLNYGEGKVIPKGRRVDIRLQTQHEGLDYRTTANLAKNCLMVVNGRIVQTHYQAEWWYGLTAGESLLKEDRNDIGLLDFTAVGGIEITPITPDNATTVVRTLSDQLRHITRVKLSMPKPMTGRTPILVVDGHIHILDGTYREVSKYNLLVEVDHSVAIQRARKRAGEALGYVQSANVRENSVNNATFDAGKYLAETDSFVVMVNTDDLSLHKERIPTTNIYGTLRHYRAPEGLVVYENRQIAHYRVTDYNEHVVSISVGDNRIKHYINDLTDWDQLQSWTNVGIAKATEKREFMLATCMDIYTF